MASLGNMLLFTFVLSFIVILGYSGDYKTLYGFQSNVSDTAKAQSYVLNNATEGIVNDTIRGVSFILPVVGTISFPNPFTLFIDVVKALFSIAYAPFTIIGALDIPDLIKFPLQYLFLGLEIYLVATWFRGQTS